jgi:hypothetical protein
VYLTCFPRCLTSTIHSGHSEDEEVAVGMSDSDKVAVNLNLQQQCILHN